MLRKLAPIAFPVILALFPALSIYIHNYYQIRFPDVIWVLATIFIITIFIIYGLRKLYGNIHKAAILTAIIVLLFFSFGHAIRSLSYFFSSLGVLDKTKYLVRGEFADSLWLLIWAIFLAAVSFLLYKYQKDLCFASNFLNFVAGAVLLTLIAQWILQVYRRPTQEVDAWISKWVNQSPDFVNSSLNIPADELPDIYYIIPDGMGREDVLKDVYQADIADFRSYLSQKGFYVADQSRSNYAWTELSLASSLNFMYLDELRGFGSETSDTSPVEIMVEDNRLFDILRRQGYQIVEFSDEYSLTDISSADIYLSPQGWVVNGYQNELINTTPLPALFRKLSIKSPYDLHRDHVLFTLTNLAIPLNKERPRFVLAHLMVPHPPYVFGANGEPVFSNVEFTFNFGVDKIGREGFITGYRDQVIFITKMLKKSLDDIIDHHSSRPLVIIVQGDHGPGLGLDWTSLENTDLNERFSIFNAYYFSDNNYQLLESHITPVNSFRVILNKYFHFNLPMLENKNYFTVVYHPYDFLDVTESLRSNAGK